MKLIKEGRKQTGWAGEFSCTGVGNGNGGCGAILLVEQRDLFLTVQSSFDGSHDDFVTFKCSQCGVLTDIKGKSTDGLLLKKDWEEKKFSEDQ